MVKLPIGHVRKLMDNIDNIRNISLVGTSQNESAK
jgi:hypothetical protein